MSLKTKNLPYLAAFLLAHVVLHLFVLGRIGLDGVAAVAEADWRVSAAATSVLMVAVLILSDWFDDIAKARLVFWRWHDPLPASAAFSQYAHEDARIDPARIDQKFGPLPTDPVQQNRLWYSIYKPLRDKPGIAQSHSRYLLLRELAAISCGIALPLAVSAFALSPRPTIWAAVYTLVLVTQVIIVCQAAANSGVRLVKNALAEASA